MNFLFYNVVVFALVIPVIFLLPSSLSFFLPFLAGLVLSCRVAGHLMPTFPALSVVSFPPFLIFFSCVCHCSTWPGAAGCVGLSYYRLPQNTFGKSQTSLLHVLCSDSFMTVVHKHLHEHVHLSCFGVIVSHHSC